MMYGANKDNTCEDCGGRLTLVFDDSDELFCKPCTVEAEIDVATAGWFNLFIMTFIFIFHFDFKYALGTFWYMIEAIFGIGDFNPKTGRFYTQGYLKAK